MAVFSRKFDVNGLKKKGSLVRFELKVSKQTKKRISKHFIPFYIGPNLSLYEDEKKKKKSINLILFDAKILFVNAIFCR